MTRHRRYKLRQTTRVLAHNQAVARFLRRAQAHVIVVAAYTHLQAIRSAPAADRAAKVLAIAGVIKDVYAALGNLALPGDGYPVWKTSAVGPS